jgi:predicted ATPase
VNGTVRFRLLDTLREYGRVKIKEAADLQDLRRRHLDWYRDLVSRAAAEWFGPNQLAWIKRLEPERYNPERGVDLSAVRGA